MDNVNKENIIGLREVINNNLDPLINDDYCLLDIPDHNNIGDNLIWAGELEYLKRLSKKSLYSANYSLCQFDRIPPKAIILLHGGGNFGDIWRDHQEFRIKVIQNFPDHKIVMFPQTVYYTDVHRLQRDAEIFNQHPDLTLCARDTTSFSTLKNNFKKNNILLVPDMAFCLNFDDHISEKSTNKILMLKRNDKELNNSLNLEKYISKSTGKQIEVKDWPTFNGFADFMYHKYFRIDGIVSKIFINAPIFGKLIDHRYGIKRRDYREYYISIGVNFINEYDEIYSTRLHVFILSVLLNKPVHIIDNSYGKNSTFYNTWLMNFKNISMLK